MTTPIDQHRHRAQERFQVISRTALDAAAQNIDSSRPIYALNLLRFRAAATYSPTDPPEVRDVPACSGREAFHTRYVPAFSRLMKEQGLDEGIGNTQSSGSGAEGTVVLWGKAMATLLDSEGRAGESGSGGGDGRRGGNPRLGGKWDDVAVIKYVSFERLRKLVEGERYAREAVPHRLAALEEREMIVLQAYEGVV